MNYIGMAPKTHYGIKCSSAKKSLVGESAEELAIVIGGSMVLVSRAERLRTRPVLARGTQVCSRGSGYLEQALHEGRYQNSRSVAPTQGLSGVGVQRAFGDRQGHSVRKRISCQNTTEAAPTAKATSGNLCLIIPLYKPHSFSPSSLSA